MKLSIKGLAFASAILWAIAVLVVGIANVIWPTYGVGFLTLIGSLYPGYEVGAGVASVVVGALYALVDGAIGGAVFAWVYNLFAA